MRTIDLLTLRVNAFVKTVKKKLGMVKTRVRTKYELRTPEKRKEILEFIKVFLDEKRYSPTIREIQRECSISSTSVVVCYLSDLEKAEAITREAGMPRTIRVL